MEDQQNINNDESNDVLDLVDDCGHSFSINTKEMTGNIYFSFDGWDNPREAVNDIEAFMEHSNDMIADPIYIKLEEYGYEIDSDVPMTSYDSEYGMDVTFAIKKI